MFTTQAYCRSDRTLEIKKQKPRNHQKLHVKILSAANIHDNHTLIKPDDIVQGENKFAQIAGN